MSDNIKMQYSIRKRLSQDGWVYVEVRRHVWFSTRRVIRTGTTQRMPSQTWIHTKQTYPWSLETPHQTNGTPKIPNPTNGQTHIEETTGTDANTSQKMLLAIL